MTDPSASLVWRNRKLLLPRPVPRRISLQITNLCNSKCTMCSIWEIYHQDKALHRTELSGEQWLTVVNNAIDSGVMSIDITGGEPFLKEGVGALLSTVLRRTGFAGVTTNALQPERILREIRNVLAEAPDDSLLAVSVSMDGFPGTYAKVRGVDGHGSVVRLLRELDALRGEYPQLNQQISFTIMDENVDEMPALMAYALDEKLIREPDDFTFRPVASGHYYAAENRLLQAQKVADTVTELQGRHSFRRTLPFISKIPQNVLEPKRMILPCYAMFASLWIDPYGGVAPCVTMTEDVIGNVRDTGFDLRPIWEGRRADEARQRIAAEKCAVCWTDCQATESLEYEAAASV